MGALQVNIRRHRFQVSCAARDEEAMRAAARLVEEKVKTLRDKTNVADGERAALMVALQIAFEFRNGASAAADSANDAKNDSPPDFRGLLRRIDGALARTESSLQGRVPMS